MDVTSTELQNNFGTYLKLAEVEDVYITRNGKRVGLLKHQVSASETTELKEDKAEYRSGNTTFSTLDHAQLTSSSSKRYELIEGDLHSIRSPSLEHQLTVGLLHSQMLAWCQKKKWKPVLAPFEITLQADGKTIVQPDISLIGDQENVDEKGNYTGIPTLVVEVVSPTTRNVDLVTKPNLYMRSGIDEYWIVNSDNREMYVYHFCSNDIRSLRVFRQDEVAISSIFSDLTLALGL